MNTAEALDRLLLYRQTPESLLRRLMDPAETVRTAAQDIQPQIYFAVCP